jgi:hemolysin activation/secretion protein
LNKLWAAAAGFLPLLMVGTAVVTAADPAARTTSELNRTVRSLEREQAEAEVRRESRRVDREEEKKADDAVLTEQKEKTASFVLQKVEFSPSSKVLRKKELNGIAQKYEKKEIDIQGLYNIVKEVNDLYRERGYLTATALLPQQEIKGGVVRVILLEGVVGEVALSGARSTEASYVLRRVKIPEGVILDFKELDRQLQWFNGTNDVKLHINLKAGKKPGTTDFSLTLQEPQRTQSVLFADNAGGDSTGETRIGLGVQVNSLSGARDNLSLAALFSSHSQTGIAGYTFPLGLGGDKATVYYNRNRLKIREEDLNNFTIQGNSSAYGLTITHPLLVRSRHRQEISLDVQKQSSRTTILGIKFVDSDETRLRLAWALTRYLPGQAFYFKTSYTHGNFRDKIYQEKFSAGKFSADFFWQKQDRRNTVYSVNLSAQKSLTSYLPAADQFYLGGLYSVRGYKENVISGDSGFSLNIEARFPLRPRLQLIAFSDVGYLFGPNVLSTKKLYSLGGGIAYEFAKNGSLTLTAGFPLQKKINDAKTDALRLHFSLNYRF